MMTLNHDDHKTVMTKSSSKLIVKSSAGAFTGSRVLYNEEVHLVNQYVN